MTARTRLWVLVVSTPVIAFALIGGYLGQAMTRDETIRNLRVFEDVVQLITHAYVEDVNVDRVFDGAMRGLSDGLDASSAYLTPDEVRAVEANQPLPAGDVGLVLTRQFYLRVVGVRDGSPARRAGLAEGDFIRAIDNRPTRDMSAFEGSRLLRGAPGSKVALLVIRGNAADPHEVVLVRERLTGAALTSRMANATTGYVRLAEFSGNSAAQLKDAVETLSRSGATRFVIDLRGTARGAYTLQWNISEDLRVQQFVEAFVSLEDGDDSFTRADTRLQSNFTESMIGQLQWVMLYDNTPAPGNERVDHTVTVSVGWSF